jgi:DNA-binding NarL/FixJ family response regulator
MLADDHAMARRSLRLLLDGEDDLEVIGRTTGRTIPFVLPPPHAS